MKHAPSAHLNAQTATLRLTQPASAPHIILGLSGGPDSIFLFHALLALHKEKKLTLVAAHFNHKWRPSSEQDELFCKELCTQHGIELHTATPEEIASFVKAHRTHTGSREADARHQRRAFFENVRKQYPNKQTFVALAHHADDQVETFFIRLMRGSSATGLAGMREKEEHIIRPLLTLSKQDIEQWLTEHALAFRIDPTNTSDAYLRNRIRHTLIPALTTCDERTTTSITKTMQQLREQDNLLSALAQEAIENLTTPDGYQLAAFRDLHPGMQQRVILQLLIAHGVIFTPSTGLLHEIIRFLSSPRGGTHAITHNTSLWKKGKLFGLKEESTC